MFLFTVTGIHIYTFKLPATTTVFLLSTKDFETGRFNSAPVVMRHVDAFSLEESN